MDVGLDAMWEASGGLTIPESLDSSAKGIWGALEGGGQAGVYCDLCRLLWYQRPLPGGGQGPSGKPGLGHTLLQYSSSYVFDCAIFHLYYGMQDLSCGMWHLVP